MKKIIIKRFILIISFISIFALFLSSKSFASTKNGTVEKYLVTVSPNANGLLNIVYNIELKVEADNINEFEIKLPNNSYAVQNKNSKISSITPNTNNDYTTIKLNNSYKTGDKITLNFSILQAHVYKKNKDSCIYKITFGDIKNFNMGKIKVQWIKNNVTFSGLGIENDKYYIWERNYSIFRKFQVSVRYDKSTFNLTDNGQLIYGIKEYAQDYALIGLAAIVIIFEILLNIIKRRNRWG